jgi:hypothetical protein
MAPEHRVAATFPPTPPAAIVPPVAGAAATPIDLP